MDISQIWASVVAGVLLGIGFAIRETRTRYPLLDFAFFRRPRFSTGAAAISLSFFAIAALTFGLTQYLQFVQGYTPLEAGIRFLPASLGLMVGAIGSEMLALRYGTTKVVTGGMLLLAGTMPLMLLWGVDTPYWVVGVVIAVVGFAAANIFAPATEAVMGSVLEEQEGIGSAINDLTRLIATALGIAVIGSAMNSIYSSRVAAAVTALPAEAAALQPKTRWELRSRSPPRSPASPARRWPPPQPKRSQKHLAWRYSSAPPSSSSEPW